MCCWSVRISEQTVVECTFDLIALVTAPCGRVRERAHGQVSGSPRSATVGLNRATAAASFWATSGLFRVRRPSRASRASVRPCSVAAGPRPPSPASRTSGGRFRGEQVEQHFHHARSEQCCPDLSSPLRCPKGRDLGPWVLTQVTSSTGPDKGGTAVTITGCGFAAGDQVAFGSVSPSR